MGRRGIKDPLVLLVNLEETVPMASLGFQAARDYLDPQETP